MGMSNEENEKKAHHERKHHEEDESLFADGGWGWVIVAVSFAASAISDGIMYSVGTFYVELIEKYNATSTEVTWIISLMNFFFCFIGPVTSLLTTIFGARVAIIVGSITIAIGFVISAFAPNIYILYVSMGVIAGAGSGIVNQTGLVMVNFYFFKRRGIANGIAVCGTGVGVLIMPLLINWVLEQYEFKGACFVLASIASLGVILGALVLSPRKVLQMRHKSESDVNKTSYDIKKGESVFKAAHIVENSTEIVEATTHIKDKLKKKPSHRHLYRARTVIVIPSTAIDIINSGNEQGNHSTIDHLKEILRASFDVKLLKTAPFLIFTLSQFFFTFSLPIPFTFMQARAIEFGISSTTANLLVSATGISGFVARIVCGLLSDREFAAGKSMYIYIGSFTVGGIATSVNFGESLAAQMAYACILGVCLGCAMCVYCMTIADLLGVENLSQAYGMSNFVSSFASLLGPFAAGQIYDTTRNFGIVYACGGAGFAICGIILLVIPCIRCCQQRGSQNHKQRDGIEVATNLAF